MANLAGLDGFRRPSRTHRTAKTGANRMMKSGGSDWYQLAGKLCPRHDIVSAAIGEEVEGRAGLLVGHPEHHRRGKEDGDHHQDSFAPPGSTRC